MRARASMRDGRFDEAFAFYQGLAAASFEAEDWFTLGSTLLGRDRLVLGWAALEAARRIDTKHAASTQAVDGLQNQLAMAHGREQLVLREAADEVEFLRAARGGPPLGMLVLGLVRYGNAPGQEQDFLDRLLVRDRAVLRAVDTTAAATKLVARLLLETGRADETARLLRPLVKNAQPDGNPGSVSISNTGTDPDAAAADRESAWLLSRAALQLDQHETADAMLELAAGFGQDLSPSPEPAPFVGSKRCGECHRAIYLEQQRNSPHAKTIALGSGLKNVPLPAHPIPDPLNPRITHRFIRLADDCIQLESRVDDQVARALIAYALGSGEHGMTMVAMDEKERIHRELRISYFSNDKSWRETKGVNLAPQAAGDFIGLELTAKSLRQCLHCHTTWFRAVAPSPSISPGPEARDRGIGCERCHGPGLNHVKAVESGFAELAIGQTSRTPALRLLHSCNECHASNGTVDPSDPEFTRVQGTTLMFSRCFTGSKGRIHCTTCHDPHRGLDTRMSRYEAKCLGCHTALTLRRDESSSPSLAGQPIQARPPICPVNPTKQCISCHMPKVQDATLGARFTDHHIRVHRDRGPAHASQARR
jgi:hypothetical protein